MSRFLTPTLYSGRKLNASSLGWLLIALLAGAFIALASPVISLSVLAIVALGLISLIDVRVGLLIMLVVAPLKTLIETESRIALPMDIGQIMFAATVGIWLARSVAAHRRLNLVWTPIYVPIIVFTLSASLSLWVSLSPGGTLTELLKWVEILFMIALVVSLVMTSPPDPLSNVERGKRYTARSLLLSPQSSVLSPIHANLHWIAGAVILAAVVQVVIGVYQFFGGSGAAHLWILDFRYFRAFGSFGQPNPFGAFMGLTLPLAIGGVFGSLTETWTAYRVHGAGAEFRSAAIQAALYAGGAAILGVGLIVSWSRGAWIGFGAAALVLLLFAPRRRAVGVALIAAVALGGTLALTSGLVPSSLLARFSDFTQDLTGFSDVRGQTISDENYAVLERFAHWQAAISMANDAPWLGVGFGNYEVAYPRYELMNWPFALGHAHNYYLNLLAETGVVGLTGYLLAWIGIFGLTLRALRQNTGFRRGLALGLLGVWVHLAVHSFFDKLYVNNLFLHLGAMLGLMGCLLLLGSTRNETSTPG